MGLREKCPVYNFGDLGDERGKLVVIEGTQAIPFDIKRIYFISQVPEGARRGFHAHKKLKHNLHPLPLKPHNHEVYLQ